MAASGLLLDTCCFLDWTLGARMGKWPSRQIARALRGQQAYLSALSVQEVLRLAEKGRVALEPSPSSWITRALVATGVRELPYTWQAAAQAGALIGMHGDPVDRGLLAAAIVAELTLVTRDGALLASGRQHGARVLDSR